MKPDELRKKSDADLTETARQLRKELYDLRSSAVTEKIEKPSQFKNLKRDVARVLTEQRTRTLAATSQAN